MRGDQRYAPVGCRRCASVKRGLQIAVRLLRGEDFGNPIVQRRLHFFLGGDDVRVALRVHHQREAHGLDGLMHPGVGERIADVRPVRLAAQRLAGFDEIVNAAVAQIRDR